MEVIYETGGARGGGCGCGGCSGCLGALMAPVMSIGIFAIVFFSIAMSRTASDEAALDALEDCAAVTEVLGEPLETTATSALGCGGYEGSGSSGHANWSISVRGPKGSASGYYTASYVNNEPWEVTSAYLDGPNGKIVAVPCQGGTRAPARDDDDDDDGDKKKRKKRRGR